jgi:hypothetical protein
MKGSLVHLLMRMIGTKVTTSARIRISDFFQGKLMRGMAAVTLFLDDVAALAESRADFLGNRKVFSMGAHSIPRDRVATLAKFPYLLGMTLPTFFRKNHGLLFRGRLVVDMAGHTMDPFLGMLRFHPGLKKARRYSLMTFHAKSRIHLGSFIGPTHARYP